MTAFVMTIGAALLLGLPARAQDPLVIHIAGSIARLEGYHSKTSAPRKANNPGSLSPRGKLLQFPTAEAGWWSLYLAVDRKLARGLTLRQLAAEWAAEPTYGAKLGKLAGLPLDERLR